MAHLFDIFSLKESDGKSLTGRLLWLLRAGGCLLQLLSTRQPRHAQRPPLGHCSHLMCICIRGPPAIECFLAHDIVIVAARLFFYYSFLLGHKGHWSAGARGLLLKFRFVCLAQQCPGSDTRPQVATSVAGSTISPNCPTLGALSFYFFYSGQHRKLQSNNKSKNCKCCKHFKYFLLIFVQPSGVCK